MSKMSAADADIMWKMDTHEFKEWKASGLSIQEFKYRKTKLLPMTAEEDKAHDEVVEKINELGNDELLELYNAQVADPKCSWMFMASNQIEVYGNPYIKCRAEEVIRHQQDLAAQRQAEFAERNLKGQAKIDARAKEQAEREANPNWGAFT